MKKSLIIILSIFIISGFLVCVNVEQVLGYHFKSDSGLYYTGDEAGYEAVDESMLDLPEAVGAVIKIILEFLGVLFLILMIYGGYIWMMARGNEQEVEKAKSIIRNALIGLIVVLAAWGIVNLVFLGELHWIKRFNPGSQL